MLINLQETQYKYPLLIMFMLLWILWRIVLIYIEPLNYDEVFFLYNGKEIIENGLFSGYTDIKVGTTFLSGVIYKLIGFDLFGYRFIGVLITILTAYFIGYIAKYLFGEEYRIAAFVFYLLFSSAYLLQVHYVTAELFQNLFFVFLVFSLLRKSRNYFFIGFLVFCTGIVRPASIFDVSMLYLWLQFFAPQNYRINTKGYFQIIVGVLVPLLGLIIYLIWLNRLPELINYLGSFVNYTASSEGKRWEYFQLFVNRNFLPLALFYLFPLVGVLFAIRSFGFTSLPVFLLIAGVVDFNSPGYYFPHYQQVLFPALALLSAYGLYRLYLAVHDRIKGAVIVIICVFGLVIVYFNNVSIALNKVQKYSEKNDSSYIDALMYYSKSGWGDRHLIKDEILANGGDKNNIFAWGDSQYYHVAIPIPYVYGNIALRDEVLPQRLQYETHRGYLKGTKPEKKLTNLIDELAENLPDYIAIEYAPEKTANDSLEVSELFLIFANYYELTLATYGNLLLYKRDTKNNFRFLSGSLIFSPSVLTTLFNIENITENGLYHTITVTPRVTSSKKNYEVRVSKPTSFEYISNLSNKMKSDYCTYQSYATNFKQGIIGLECARDDIIYISSAIGHDEWHSKENGHTKILDYYINDKQVDIDYRESINKPKKLRVFFSNGEVWAYNFDGDY